MWKLPQRYSNISEQKTSENGSSTSLTVDDFEIKSRFERFFTYRKAFFLLLGALVIIIFGGILNSKFNHHPTTSPTRYPTSSAPCGNTTAEARSQGCEFDLLSYSWL